MGLPLTVPGPVAASTPDTTPILTSKPIVRFTTLNVQPPTGVYVTVDDVVHVAIWNSVANIAVNVTYRILLADGTIQLGVQTFSPTSARLRNDFYADLAEGFLLSVVVATSTAGVIRGQCFVELDVARITGSIPQDRQPLLSDYVTSANSFGWPGGQQRTSIEGPGLINTQLVAGASPPSVSTTVPTGARWRFISCLFGLNTDAIAGTRLAVIQFVVVAAVTFEAAAVNTQAPSLSNTYVASSAPVGTSVPAGAPIPMPTPADFILKSGSAINITILNSDAGDSIPGSAKFTYEEWLEPSS